uniref:Uncharacterized protein n=1 Tax=Arundo donax TaxID=35708 RepID=A0A0A9DG28_ARUDO
MVMGHDDVHANNKANNKLDDESNLHSIVFRRRRRSSLGRSSVHLGDAHWPVDGSVMEAVGGGAAVIRSAGAATSEKDPPASCITRRTSSTTISRITGRNHGSFSMFALAFAIPSSLATASAGRGAGAAGTASPPAAPGRLSESDVSGSDGGASAGGGFACSGFTARG